MVGAWANSCSESKRYIVPVNDGTTKVIQCILNRVHAYLKSKRVMVPATTHMLQEIISLQQPYMGKRSRLAAECCVHKFLLGVEGRGVPEYNVQLYMYMKALKFPSGTTNDVFPPLWIPTHTTIEPVPEYSNVRGSHHLIVGQSVVHLYDQRCSALSSWRQHIASVRSATLAQRDRETLWETSRRVGKRIPLAQ